MEVSKLAALRQRIKTELEGLHKMLALSDEDMAQHLELIKDHMHGIVIGGRVIENAKRVMRGETYTPTLRMYVQVEDGPASMMMTLTIEHSRASTIPPEIKSKWEEHAKRFNYESEDKDGK